MQSFGTPLCPPTGYVNQLVRSNSLSPNQISPFGSMGFGAPPAWPDTHFFALNALNTMLSQAAQGFGFPLGFRDPHQTAMASILQKRVPQRGISETVAQPHQKFGSFITRQQQQNLSNFKTFDRQNQVQDAEKPKSSQLPKKRLLKTSLLPRSPRSVSGSRRPAPAKCGL